MPLDDKEISQKFHLFANQVIGKDKAKQVHDLALSFDALSADEFAELMGLCCGGDAF